ncbi:5'-nucleotidase C-terminal domain-containing protein, partial [candidate division KSB1 bacterium]|nr:5'-nucleotidase C-terminal domain-containing protein [candidate division KSB1 bacterium]
KAEQISGTLPKIVLTNMELDSSNAESAQLKKLYEDKKIHEYLILEKADLKIGVFAVLGNEEIFKLQQSPGFLFKDPELSAQQASRFLQQHEKVDIIVCLTFSGMSKKPGSTRWTGETQYLGLKAPDIDIIISGGTNSVRTDTVYSENTPVLQSAARQQSLNIAEVLVASTQREIKRMQQIDGKFSEQRQSSRNGVQHDFALRNTLPASGLGNFITDAMLWAAQQTAANTTDFAFFLNENIRVQEETDTNSLLTDQDVEELFPPIDPAQPNKAGFPLVKINVTGSDLQKILEINSSVYPLKGNDYFLHFAGLHVRYNTSRILFNRVIGAQKTAYANDAIPILFSEEQIYSIVTDWITAQRLSMMHKMTSGFLQIHLLGKDGSPVQELSGHVLQKAGDPYSLQTIIEDYCSTFADVDANGVPDIPEKYGQPQMRMDVISSMMPHDFLQNPSVVMVVLIIISLLMLVGVIAVVVVVVRRIRA